jgi:hypothetical protein
MAQIPITNPESLQKIVEAENADLEAQGYGPVSTPPATAARPGCSGTLPDLAQLCQWRSDLENRGSNHCRWRDPRVSFQI